MKQTAVDQRECPQCGGVLELDAHCTIDEPYVPKYPIRHAPLPRRRRVCRAVLCAECDYCAEEPRFR